MLQQFKRAIRVAIVRGNAKHKLARVYTICQSHIRRSRSCPYLQMQNQPQCQTNGIHVKAAEQAGYHNTPLKGKELSNSSAMDMTSVCIECTQSHDMIYMYHKLLFMFNPL